MALFLSYSLFFMPIFMIYILILPYKLKYRKQACIIVRGFAKFCMFAVWGIKFRFENSIGETFKKPAIMIGNHQSMLDLIVVHAINPQMVTVTNKWVWKSPFFSYILKYIGHIPAAGIDGKDVSQLVEERLNEGFSVFIFPEGTRTKDGKIGRFHRGAFEMAERLGVDIVGILIKGAYELAPRGRLKAYSGTVTTEIARRESYTKSETPRYREICHEWHDWYVERLKQ